MKMIFLQVQQQFECQLQLLQNKQEHFDPCFTVAVEGKVVKGAQGKVTERVCVRVSWVGMERGKGHGVEGILPEVLP